ncbi:Hedgehog/Intein (Hint) domain containing protein [Paracoccaceae bacterium]
MAAHLIPVDLYALDQFDLPARQAGVGLASALAMQPPVLRQDARQCRMWLAEGIEGMSLGAPLTLAGVDQPQDTRVTVEALPGLAAFLLVRIGGTPVGLAMAGPGTDAESPELLSAFAAGTLIDTPDGHRAVETLVAGDRITTLANGSRPLVWVGHRRIMAVEILAYPGLRPLLLPKGSAGNDRPLLVSPRQRMLIDDWRAEVYFGEDRVLVSAEALSDSRDIRPPLSPEGVVYVMLLCDRHEILVAEGALTESFHPGETGLTALTAPERSSLAAVAAETDLARRRAAYPIVRNAEARALRLST